MASLISRTYFDSKSFERQPAFLETIKDVEAKYNAEHESVVNYLTKKMP